MHSTFSFIDLSGFSALTETHGDDAGADLVKRFEHMIQGVIEQDGELVAMVGDAAFLASPEPGAALSVLKRLWAQVETESEFPELRAGLHHGEAVRRDRNYFGTAVNVAARVAAQARGGQVLATALVADTARQTGLAVTALGSVRLKNLRDAVELFTLKLGRGAETEAIDPVCRMRIVRERAAAHLTLGGREHWFCSAECLRLFVSQAPST